MNQCIVLSRNIYSVNTKALSTQDQACDPHPTQVGGIIIWRIFSQDVTYHKELWPQLACLFEGFVYQGQKTAV